MPPEFIDLQVNGFRGVDFSSPDLTDEGIAEVGRALWERGIAAYCPTMITAPLDVYAHCLPLLAKHQDRPEAARILGIHLEGPFISPEDGARGAHPRAHVTIPCIDNFERLRDWGWNRIALLTLAPEQPGALKLIEHVRTNSPTIISLGHTMADAETIHAARAAGAQLATHVGNGLCDLIHRHQNPMWPILADDGLTAMMITDGFHLPSDLIRVIVKAKGARSVIVTSDVTHLSGMPPGEYQAHGAQVVLEEDGRLHCKGEYRLAGSASDMRDCMDYLRGLGALSDEELGWVGGGNAKGIFREFMGGAT